MLEFFISHRAVVGFGISSGVITSLIATSFQEDFEVSESMTFLRKSCTCGFSYLKVDFSLPEIFETAEQNY